jgi:hypothetical protein
MCQSAQNVQFWHGYDDRKNGAADRRGFATVVLDASQEYITRSDCTGCFITDSEGLIMLYEVVGTGKAHTSAVLDGFIGYYLMLSSQDRTCCLALKMG